MAADSPWLNAGEAANYLRRGRRFILREVKAGRLRAARIGGRGEVLTRREWCDEFAEAQARPIEVTRRRAG